MIPRLHFLGAFTHSGLLLRVGRQRGDIIDDKYAVIRKLGEGSSGVTYEALSLDGTRVAIKEFALGKIKNWKQFDLFEREAKMLKCDSASEY